MSSNSKKSKSTQRGVILGDRTFAAISAVEGLRLNAQSKQRLAMLESKKLTPAQKRAEILRAYAGKKDC